MSGRKEYFEKLNSWLYPIAWDLLWLEGGEEEEVINVLSRKASRLFCNKSLEGGWRLRVINREGRGAIAMQAACVLHHPTWLREVGDWERENKEIHK